MCSAQEKAEAQIFIGCVTSLKNQVIKYIC